MTNPMGLMAKADDAELSLLLTVLLAEHERHIREGCSVCRRARRPGPRVEQTKTGPRPARADLIAGACCAKIVAGVRVVTEWHAARRLATRATILRNEIEAFEAAHAA